MTTAETEQSAGEDQATRRLAERIFGACIAAQELASMYIGDRLGFYEALAAAPLTPAELAQRAGAVERYAREWLEQQAVAGVLSVQNVDTDARGRRYSLPEAHRPVLLDDNSLSYMLPLAQLMMGVLRPLDDLLTVYRKGGGVPYEAYGDDTVQGIARINRPMYLRQLADWFAAVPEIDQRLRSEPGARVADFACGTAWSSIAIARAYPSVTVDALDVDAVSIQAATENVARAGLAGRVRPRLQDASAPELAEKYDLVTIFEALHDMAHPVEALRAARALLAPGGSALVADERVAERFTAPGDDVERFNYGWSVLHCLTVGMTVPGSAETGTVLRPDALRAYAKEAGFSRVDIAPIENDFWRFYRLLP